MGSCQDSDGFLSEDGSVLDVTKRDRFELISAYLDGEVTPHERRLVADWLAHDPEVQHLYRRLLMLRQAFRALPVAAIEPSAPLPIWRRLHHHRLRTASLAFAFTAVTLLLTSFTSLVNGWGTPWRVMRLGQSDVYSVPYPGGGSRTVPELALDEPAIELPQSIPTEYEGGVEDVQ